MLELEHIIQIDYFTYIQAQLEQTQLGQQVMLLYLKVLGLLLFNYLHLQINQRELNIQNQELEIMHQYFLVEVLTRQHGLEVLLDFILTVHIDS